MSMGNGPISSGAADWTVAPFSLVIAPGLNVTAVINAAKTTQRSGTCFVLIILTHGAEPSLTQ